MQFLAPLGTLSAMYRNFVRKSLGLLFAYIVIIVGIFILQFRSDSVISEKIGNLRISLAETRGDDGMGVLRNRMIVSFNGITFTADDTHPLTLAVRGERTPRNLALVSWKKPTPRSCEFSFSDGVLLSFSVSGSAEAERLTVHASLPENAADLRLHYEIVPGAAVVSETDTHVQLDIRNSRWEFEAAEILGGAVAFTDRASVASYSYYDATKKFSFENTSRFASAERSAYSATIVALKQNLIAAFAGQQDITEQEAVSFVAAMSERGRYNEAINAVPSSFRRGVQRTYLSSPYFDTLATMNRSLEQQIARYRDIVSQNTIDAFSVSGIVDYMCMHPGSDAVRTLLATAADANSLTVSQAASILAAYDLLLAKNADLAAIVQGAAQVCIDKITESCSVENERITISENGAFVSVVQAAEIGDALVRYGQASGEAALERGGYVILNSYLAESASFDLRTLAALYPIVVHDNPYYPHFALLGFDGGDAVWAWTCAANMTYQNDGRGTVTVTIDFPQSYTHYVIINGIRRFRTIYIYDMAFRTDPRFETYNSSGYVYRADTNTLLLKSRHKSQIETIRFIYSDAAREAAERRTITETDAAGNVIAPPPEPSAPASALPEGNIPMSTGNASPESAE